MPKLSVVVRNHKRKHLVERYAKKRETLRKEQNFKALNRLPKNSSPVRLRNRCWYCGRGKGVLRFFLLCRIHFRELAAQGKIPGLRKVSW